MLTGQICQSTASCMKHRLDIVGFAHPDTCNTLDRPQSPAHLPSALKLEQHYTTIEQQLFKFNPFKQNNNNF